MTDSGFTNILAVYAEPAWHDDADVVGDREGLTALRDAIDAALATGYGRADVTMHDGEGYTVHVAMGTYDEFARLETPYTEGYAQSVGGESVDQYVREKQEANGNGKA